MTTIAYSGLKQTNSNAINAGTSSIGQSTEASFLATPDPIINIHVSCENVIKLDIGSDSDPLCVLFIPVNGKYVEVARTEVVWNDCNPNWVKFFQTLYIFETNQPLRFCVYDCDSEKAPLANHDFVGQVDTDVQSLVSNGANLLRLELKNPAKSGKRGTLVLQCEQATQSSSIIQGQFQFTNLKKMHTFSKNCPYLVISKPSESGQLIPTFRSEVIKKAVSGRWKPFNIPMQNICNGDLQIPLTFTVYHYNSKSAGEFIGADTQSLQSLMESGGKLNLLDKKNKKAGFVIPMNLQIIRKPTFYDYLRSGLQLNLITAIDFTASNRDPCDPKSLHHLTHGAFNQYESCIWSVGSVVCPYDTDQMFPTYGFGGKIGGTVSHCFPLTFNQNPNVSGLQGILQFYRDSLNKVILSGPTLFSPIINAATQVARVSYQQSKTYTILLILTDGVINDLQDTIDSIVEASDAPLSIIIVGVGDADFSAMDKLDADENPLVARGGAKMKRDIVQFVPYNKFARQNGMGLSTAVLAEVPTQVHEFCSSHGFVPSF